MKKAIPFLFILVLTGYGLSGQKAPIKYGDVSMEELQMSSYPPDTAAAAVILCDYGAFTAMTSQIPFQFTRIRRIKILKKEGYSWANSGYPCNINTQIRGITFNLENGKIVKTNLKHESIFKDRVTEDMYIMRIAMPDVRVGSVIELQFNTIMPLKVWKFQEDIPVKYSELILEDVQAVRFNTNFFGYEPIYLSSPNRWVAKDMPSFKEEPVMTSKENYLSKLEIDILDVGFRMSITGSWESISSLLLKDDYFGKALASSAYLNNLAKSIEDSKGSREEMMKRAFEGVRSTVKWNEQESLFASAQTISYPFKMKIGNSADINLILLQLLKKLDFDASPVAMSTRENGFLSPNSPSMQKLNYLIVLVKLDGKSILLDATEPFMPYWLLPFRSLNYNGRAVNEKNSEQVDIGTACKEKEFVTYQLKIQENNDLKGKMMLKKIEYSALNFRKKYHKFNSINEYLEDFTKDKQGLILNESAIANIDSAYLPVVEDYSITIKNQLNEIGDELYILPMFYHQLQENPFKMDIRKYPVDYGYNIERTITTSIEIPDNYVVSELPAAIKFKLPDNAASLTYLVNQTGNTINVKSVFSINKSIFLQDEYKGLKEFYNQVVKKHSEPIILKRK